MTLKIPVLLAVFHGGFGALVVDAAAAFGDAVYGPFSNNERGIWLCRIIEARVPDFISR